MSWPVASAALSAMILLAGCAQERLVKPTKSGMAEGRFENATLDDVRNKLVGWCAQDGAAVLEASGNQVVCSRTMTGGQAVMAQVLIGNSYSTTPEARARFTMYQAKNDVNVVAAQWMETTMAMGQARRVELKEPQHINRLQAILDELGAK